MALALSQGPKSKKSNRNSNLNIETQSLYRSYTNKKRKGYLYQCTCTSFRRILLFASNNPT